MRLMPMAVSGYRHTDKNKHELIEEIVKLKEKLRAKDAEIEILKKRLALYEALE
jgi:hypothetical protein